MIQDVTGCTGDYCPRRKSCALFKDNLAKTEDSTFALESWATFGSAAAWANSHTGEVGNSFTYFCGPNGNYKMFRECKRDLAELTLHEMQQICLKHQAQNRDCETCELFRFCNYEMSSTYPSAWKLGKRSDNND